MKRIATMICTILALAVPALAGGDKVFKAVILKTGQQDGLGLITYERIDRPQIWSMVCKVGNLGCKDLAVVGVYDFVVLEDDVAREFCIRWNTCVAVITDKNPRHTEPSEGIYTVLREYSEIGVALDVAVKDLKTEITITKQEKFPDGTVLVGYKEGDKIGVMGCNLEHDDCGYMAVGESYAILITSMYNPNRYRDCAVNFRVAGFLPLHDGLNAMFCVFDLSRSPSLAEWVHSKGPSQLPPEKVPPKVVTEN